MNEINLLKKDLTEIEEAILEEQRRPAGARQSILAVLLANRNELQLKIETLIGGDVSVREGDFVSRDKKIDQRRVELGARAGHIGDGATGNVLLTGDGSYVTIEAPGGKTGGTKPADLRELYLRRVFQRANTLSLAGIDPKAAREGDPGVLLGEIYTPLLTLTTESLEQMGERGKGEQGKGEQKEPRRLSAVEQLDQHRKLVLLGDPGSGKSVFINFVALCLAGQELGDVHFNLDLLTTELPGKKEDEKIKQPWSRGNLLPVRVILRDYAARGAGGGKQTSAKSLWDYICAELEQAALADYAPGLYEELCQKGGMLLLDGLDEAPEAGSRRVQICRAVEDFAATFQKCHILVTSRTYAYQKQEWKLAGFSQAALAPFVNWQVNWFIERWYVQVGIARHQEKEDAAGRGELLKTALRMNDRLRDFASRPLLLTLMASLHAWRGGTLPDKREELYADSVELLLDWWVSPKVVRDAAGNILASPPSLVEWLKIDRGRMRSLLNQLAYEAHAGQAELAGTADIAEEHLVNSLLRLIDDPDLKPARLIEFLSQLAGLLSPRGVGVYTFPHRSFQEYLAACHLTDTDYPDKIADLARKDADRWREVALLAGAKSARGTSSAVWQLVDALCFREADEPAWNEKDDWGARLAGQALLETANLDTVGERNQPRLERVKGGLRRVIENNSLNALERVGAGDVLAYLGDPRFDPQRWNLPGDDLLGFVEIPPGSFLMGSHPGKDKDADDDEKPQHEVNLPRYFIARYPVTVAQYREFVQDREYAAVDKHSLAGLANHPVVDVTWNDAYAYGEWLDEKLKELSRQRLAQQGSVQDFWLGLQTGKLRVRLPSEAEWEKAARGMDGRIFPWGNQFDLERANAQMRIGRTSAVGCFPEGRSPYQILDMSGNVWEWTRSAFKPYPYQPEDGREDLSAGKNIARVLRGGSFLNLAGFVRCACRDGYSPSYWGSNVGFRVVVSPPFTSDR